jgi:hypothetical protein
MLYCVSSVEQVLVIKQDCLIPPRARTVTTVVAENKTFIEDVVCMLVSNPKSYTKEQLLIPNSVNEIKGGKTSFAISDFGNQPKILIAGSMVGF